MVRYTKLCRTCLLSAIAAVGLAPAGASAGTFTTITLDGAFDDWAGVPVLLSDPSGDGNIIDIANVQIANDAANLYLRISYHTPVNPNVGPSIFLAFDRDRDLTTGFNIYGQNVVGSDAGFQNDFPFDQRGGFNSGSLTASATIAPIDFADPGNVFSSQEYSIPRNIAYSTDGVPVFLSPGFNLMLWTDANSSPDTTTAISYDFASPVNSFINPNGGDYNLSTNWSAGTVPNAVDAAANFGPAITATRTVFSNAAVTVGKLTFDNANQYVIGGTGSLTIDVATGAAAIDVLQGSQKINLPLRLNDSTTATVSTGATLTIADPLTLANGSGLTKAGGGTLEILSTVAVTGGTSSISTSAGTTNLRLQMGAGVTIASSGGETRTFTTQRVNAVTATGGTVSIDSAGAAKVLVTDALTLSGPAKLDVGDNGVIVRGGSAAAVRAAIITGRAGGAGIVTTASTAGRAVGYANSTQIGNPTSFLGEPFAGPAVLIRYTLAGDSNLSATVDFADLSAVAQNYGTSGKEWFQGDFDYDGAVGFSDLSFLAQNYNGTALTDDTLAALGTDSFAADWALALSLVPEPTSMIVLAGIAPVAFRRRR